MINKTRKKPATTLSTDELAEAQGGHHKHNKHNCRTRTFLTMEQKLSGKTEYSTNGKNLYYQDDQLGSMDDLLPR